MSNFYVSAAGSSTSPFDTWAKAGNLSSVLAVPPLAGDDIWIAATHTETASSAVTYGFPGTNASPNRCIAASTISGNAPPVSSDLVSSASPSVASSTNGSITLTGDVYFRGIVFNGGSSTGTGGVIASNTGGNFQKFELCSINKIGTGAGGQITFGGGAGGVWLVNTNISFGSVTDTLNVRGRHLWQNGSITSGAAVPSPLFTIAAAGSFVVEGVDLSAITGILCPNNTTGPQSFYFKDCKLNASASVLPATSITTFGLSSNEAYVVRCDSGATTYRQEKHNYCADLVQNTSITRVGGATDGTTQISWQITTTSHSNWYNNFQSFPISMWYNSPGAPVTIVIHATSNLAASGLPNNDDIWIEVEYLGSNTTPLGSFATNTISNVLATKTAYVTDGTTWNNAPTGGTFKMSVTVTPQQSGPITVYVRCAKVSTIFYVDPLITNS